MKELFLQNTVTVAQLLLGKSLEINHPTYQCGGIIAETEAYTQDDPACHAFEGKKTNRNTPMFKDAGHLYIYFIYGMYHCLNIVTESKGIGSAVLIREVIPIKGITHIKRNRPTIKTIPSLLNGPAKVVMGLGIQPGWNGLSLFDSTCPITISGKSANHSLIKSSPRIGISKGQDRHWRFWIDSPK